MKKKLSVVVPCYNEKDALPIFYKTIIKVESKIKEVEFEYIFVDDGSKDSTLEIIKKISKKNKNVRYISFSRNFGKEAAMLAGLEYSKGDYVTIMDVDLQDPPEMLIDMYYGITKEGYDCVATRRITRKGEPVIRSFFAKRFYKLINRISKVEMVDGARDFRLMTRQMVDSIISLKEYNRYSKGLFSFVGYKTKWLEYKNVERIAGKTKWSFWNLLVYAFEGIIAFSTMPLVIATIVGILFFLVSFAMIIFIIIKTLAFGDPVSGWPSLVCIIFFISGIQLFCIGIIGQYLAKTYLEVKKRPVYIIKDTKM